MTTRHLRHLLLAISLVSVHAPVIARAEPAAATRQGARASGSVNASPSSDRPVAVIDFGDEDAFGVGDTMVVRDPAPVAHESLLPARYRLADAAPPDDIDGVADSGQAPSRWNLGVAVDLGLASFSGSASTTARLGGFLAVFARYRVSSHLALRPEIQLASKGALPGDAAVMGAATTRLTQLAFPILVQVEVGLGTAAVHGAVGPSLGITLGGASGPGSAEIERLDLAGAMALGTSFPLFSRRFTVELRGEHGLLPTARVRSGEDSRAVRSRSLAVALGVEM